MWWAAAKITTVGYGGLYPMTFAARSAAAFAMVVGITVFELLATQLAAFLSHSDV